MRIHYLSSSIVPSKSANSIHVVKMVAAMAEAGHEVVLHARVPPDGLGSPESVRHRYGVEAPFAIEWHRWWPVRGVGGLLYGESVRRHVASRRREIDLLYGRDLYSLHRCRGLGVPIRYECHVLPGSRVRQRLERQLVHSSSFERLVVISKALEQAYTEGVPELGATDVVIAHDGADEPVTEHLPGRGVGNAIRVGYVGHLHPGKGAEMVPELARRLPEMQFEIVGGQDDVVREWRVRHRIDNLLLRGWVDPKDVPSVIATFDIVLAPYGKRVSAYGGSKGDIAAWMSPLKLFEYMALGRSIVVSDLPVLREVVRHEFNALLCPPNDIDAWVEAIQRLGADPSLRMRLGEQARREFLDEYTWPRRVRLVLG